LNIFLARLRFGINNSSSTSTLNDSENKPQTTQRIQIAGPFGGRQDSPPQNLLRPPINLFQKPTPSYDATEVNKAQENSDLTPTTEFDSDELFLRDFFPEVWLFKDFTFG
jgi:hypothetical protein